MRSRGRWNRRSASDFGADVEVDTHIEPLEPELPLGTESGAGRIEIIRKRACAARGQADGALHDIHNVRVRDSEGRRVR